MDWLVRTSYRRTSGVYSGVGPGRQSAHCWASLQTGTETYGVFSLNIFPVGLQDHQSEFTCESNSKVLVLALYGTLTLRTP
jgi:hypothetical protein